MTVTVRSATLGDIADVLTLWREADAEPTHTDNAESVDRLIVHDSGALIVAEANNRIVGSVIAGWDGWRGSVYRLVVAPSHRRQGLGRRLVREAENRLMKLGAVRYQAIVVENDSRATAFWRSTGWDQQAQRLRFVKG